MTFQISQHESTHIPAPDMQTTMQNENGQILNSASNFAQQDLQQSPQQTQPVAPTTSIADQLLGAFPSGTYCLPALLSLAEIVETTSVATAAVECTLRPRFLINPEWVAQHAQTVPGIPENR